MPFSCFPRAPFVLYSVGTYSAKCRDPGVAVAVENTEDRSLTIEDGQS